MSAARQGDLFGSEAADGDDAETPEYHADPEKVREELHRILAEMRAATSLPWEPAKERLFRTIFPQMANWLPKEEGEQLCFQFEEELLRLKAA